MIVEHTVTPLTRTTRSGKALQRPARIQAEIAAALKLSAGEILKQAAADPTTEGSMSEECMVHLIRRDVRARSSPPRDASGTTSPRRAGFINLAEDLTPLLLERCDRGLKRAIRGFPPSAAAEIREEILGRLAVSLVGPGNSADFFEVRFNLALKRLRIDICRRERRRLQGLVALEDVSPGDAPDDPESATLDRTPPSPPSQEDRLMIQQALSTLTAEERKVLVLHKLAGVPLSSSKAPPPKGKGPPEGVEETTPATLVGLLGRSERTLRNRLRSAEAKLGGLQERKNR